MTKTRSSIEWYPEEVHAGRFGGDTIELAIEADDFDPDSLVHPCVAYVRIDRFAALQAENARLREALADIATSDDTENALDPERNKRVAETALSSTPQPPAGRTDRERLDWLGRQYRTSTVYMDGTNDFRPRPIYLVVRGTDFRAAIDATMDREGKDGE